MRKIVTGIGAFFQLTKQEKTVAVFLLVSLVVGNAVLFVKRRRADFAPDLVVSEQPTLEQLSRKGDSLARTGMEYIRVNINTATLEELQSLPGIGRATAAKILHYRDSLGEFRTPKDLIDVKGIGEAKYRRLKGCIVTDPPR
jgi:competence ComEA-like helix-hairpin-helix protein